jgi:hypothetical protein
MIGPIEKQPFYWLLFRVSDDAEARWESGRVIITPERDFWLVLRHEDVVRLAPLRAQLKLDETRLLERFDDELGGAYFVHHGPIQEKQ